tara:strand:+ start:23880 stop:24071 length:192 start_codon:yes stop_codon:yes gene_type:complete
MVRTLGVIELLSKIHGIIGLSSSIILTRMKSTLRIYHGLINPSIQQFGEQKIESIGGQNENLV